MINKENGPKLISCMVEAIKFALLTDSPVEIEQDISGLCNATTTVGDLQYLWDKSKALVPECKGKVILSLKDCATVALVPSRDAVNAKREADLKKWVAIDEERRNTRKARQRRDHDINIRILRGETISSIAKRYGISPQSIRNITGENGYRRFREDLSADLEAIEYALMVIDRGEFKKRNDDTA